MRNTLRNIWPLFFGLFLIGLAIGIQGSLLGLRADSEGFSTFVTGLVMSGYYVGFLFGSIRGPKIIKRVGHVRTFGALTALASVTILVHMVFVEPWVWFVMRVITGVAISGIYVVAESWLNASADDRNRGQILSAYMITMFLGLFGGQFLLNLADPDSFELFSLISILVSFAAIPILLTASPTPVIEQSESISLRKLFAWAPYGVIGCFLVNMCLAMVFGMAAVYASQIGMSIKEVSYFMGAIIFGGLILQWPIGRISDLLDRRMVLAATAALAAIFALLCTTTDKANFELLLLYSALFGGFVLPLYALTVALVNDFMRPQNIVAASGTILMIGGIGSTLGPLAVAGVMDLVGPQGFFLSMAGICLSVALYGVYRLMFHDYVEERERHEFHIYAPAMVGTVLHAEADTEQAGVEADINRESA